MPRARSVSFEAKPVYSRLPRDDEKYVMKAFAKHASHCAQCANPYQTHRAGATLCTKGHRRALDVAQYVYAQAGNAYSMVDREGRDGHGRQEVQLEIPAGCEAVRSLLRAMERGLRLIRERQEKEHKDEPRRGRHERRESSLESMDRTYYIAPRTVVVDQSARPHRSTSSSSSGSTSSAHSARSSVSSIASASSRSSVESVDPSITRLSRSKTLSSGSARADREKYYAAAPLATTKDQEAWPRKISRAHTSSTLYAPRDHRRESQGYYSFPAYQAPRRSSIAIWS